MYMTDFERNALPARAGIPLDPPQCPPRSRDLDQPESREVIGVA